MTSKKDTRLSRLNSKKSPIYSKWWVWLIVLIIAVFVSFNLGIDKGSKERKNEVVNENKVNNNNINDSNNQNNDNYEEESNHDKGNENNDNKEVDETEEQSILDGYDVHEIDYARILLMLDSPRINPENPVVYVYKIEKGTPIFTDGQISYSEDVVSLRTDSNIYSNHDADTVHFSVHGEGNITVYYQASVFEMMQAYDSPEELDKLAESTINSAEDMYIDPSTPEKVAEFINKVEFKYQNE